MKKNKGQVALVVLIISAIALTLGLTLADRVRTDIKTDTDDEQLQRAFNAAESGIENYLVNPGTGYTGSDGSTADVTSHDVTGVVIEFGKYTVQDDYAYFWLVGHDSNDNIDISNIYGGDSVDICFDEYDGSMAVYYFGMNGASYDVIREVYNIDGSTNEVENGSSSDHASGVCGGFEVGIEDFDVSGFTTPLLIVIKPLFGGSRFALQGTSDFPSQGEIIDSTGRSGQASTMVSVYKRWDPSYYMAFMLEGLVARNSIN